MYDVFLGTTLRATIVILFFVIRHYANNPEEARTIINFVKEITLQLAILLIVLFGISVMFTKTKSAVKK